MIYSFAQKNFQTLRKDILLFYSFFLLSVVIGYLTSDIIGQIYFVLLLYLFYKSTKPIFWLAFFFVIMNAPGGFFSISQNVIIQGGIPSFNVSSGISISYFDLFFFTGILKSFKLQISTHRDFNYKIHLYLLLSYFVFLSFQSVLNGMLFKDYIAIMRLILSIISLTLICAKVFNTSDNFIYFFYLIFPSGILLVLQQIYFKITGLEIVSLVSPSSVMFQKLISFEERRAADFYPELVLMIFFGAFIVNIFRKDKINNIISNSIIFLSLFVVFFSATRTWMIVFPAIFLFYLLVIKKNIVNVFAVSLLGIPVFLFLLLFEPIQATFSESVGRFATLEFLLSSDYKGEASISNRALYRFPAAEEKFLKSPVTGLGFTDEFMIVPTDGKTYTGDMHTGNMNLLANSGIIGQLLFISLWISFLKNIILFKNKFFDSHNKALQLLGFVFIIILLTHFTAYQFFGFTLPIRQNFFMLILLFYSETLLKEKI